MQLQVILNRVQRHQGFVYKKAKLVEKRDGPVVEVDIEPRSNSRAICSGCGRTGPGYDREQTPRSFQFVPLWGMAVFFLYAMRRVDCRQCGVNKADRNLLLAVVEDRSDVQHVVSATSAPALTRCVTIYVQCVKSLMRR